MKLITLNTWGGRLLEPLVQFIEKHKKDTDIFCFQEVYNGGERIENQKGVTTDLLLVLKTLLADYGNFYVSTHSFEYDGKLVPFGQAIFYRKELPVSGTGFFEIFMKEEKVELPVGISAWYRHLGHITLPYKDSHLTICNFHGLYTGGEKNDGQARLLQSQRIARFLNDQPGYKLLCGDFNMDISIEALKILEHGMKNLVRESGVTSTRSSHFKRDVKFADYILLSPEVEVKSFQVLPDEVSDHLPLVVEF